MACGTSHGMLWDVPRHAKKNLLPTIASMYNYLLTAAAAAGVYVRLPFGCQMKMLAAAVVVKVVQNVNTITLAYLHIQVHHLEPYKQRGHPTLSAWDVPAPVGPPIRLCGMSHIILRGTSLLRHMLVGRPSLPGIT
ncbi:hypothetical protein FB451DRAFT_1184819 [Mycena latifolia]|nr:hypothetical protein FB451DRAFT_1184819 [Mycena latifolia]